MALNSINTNVASYFAQANINSANSATSSSIGRLSSGNRLVRASDDVAAMSIGTSLRTQVNSLKVGLQNASQGTSLLQVADGALSQAQDMLLRQKAIATQANSGSLTSTERGFLNQEFQSLTNEINRLTESTNFNGVKLLDGTLGSKSILASTDASAAAFVAGGGNIITTTAVQAFNTNTGLTAGGANTAGNLQFVDNTNTILANGDYLNINSSVYGSVGKFEISNLVDGVSATIKTTINGIEFTGTAATDANTGNFVVSNGNTRIAIGYATLDLTSAATAQVATAALNTAFANVEILRTQQLTGVDFTGTALAGVSGAAASGTPMIRTSTPGDTTISNFEYVSNSGTGGTNVLTVQIAGETYTATAVADAVAATTVLSFSNGTQEGLSLTLTGLTTGITNIRTSEVDRNNFISALNQAFAGAAGGVDFAVGASKGDSITVKITSATTATLYSGESLNVSTQADAARAGEVLDNAIKKVTSVRADVGAQMARFDYTSANIEISLQNQDAARGGLLDTDVAAESTAYATSQVQLQAGIAVLAQANQLPQNLLKLLG